MNLDSLLLTRDQQVIGVLRPALEKLSIDVEICRGARSGNEILVSEKFDAVIVDCDDLDGGIDVLESVQKSATNKNSVTFAILNGNTTTQKAFELGAKFVLQKPVSSLNATRCFSAALNFMMKERRRYFRHPVELPVFLEFGQQLQVKAVATNLSDGGMAIHFRGTLPKTGLCGVSFSLPGDPAVIETKATMAWVDAAGRAGVRFTEVPAKSREKLDHWVSEQLEKMSTSAKESAPPA
jgi:c-di-GMP-binding flagellar brake protein YcgR